MKDWVHSTPVQDKLLDLSKNLENVDLKKEVEVEVISSEKDFDSQGACIVESEPPVEPAPSEFESKSDEVKIVELKTSDMLKSQVVEGHKTPENSTVIAVDTPKEEFNAEMTTTNEFDNTCVGNASKQEKLVPKLRQVSGKTESDTEASNNQNTVLPTYPVTENSVLHPLIRNDSKHFAKELQQGPH